MKATWQNVARMELELWQRRITGQSKVEVTFRNPEPDSPDTRTLSVVILPVPYHIPILQPLSPISGGGDGNPRHAGCDATTYR